ncbi:MAG TPA: class I SAM-dependent methyltransferase [Chloroflexota bacterium]|nr:class I SAM-dependent methyltransferase [Chloroflexota bacterium]
MNDSIAAGNLEQAHAWNGEQGLTWLRFEDQFNRAIRGYGERLVASANIEPAASVLDVGCGSGDVARMAARQAHSGSVLGLDLSNLMIGRAIERARAEGLENLRFEVGDAQSSSFAPASFDVVISRFGVMFFADPVAAFDNIRRAGRNGGRLLMMAWKPLEENEWQLEMRRALAQGRRLPLPESGVPGPFSFSDPEYVRKVLVTAGWREVMFESIQQPYVAGEGVGAAYTFLSEQSVARSLLSELDEAGKTRALVELRDSISRHQIDAGVIYASAAWLITART